MRLAHWLLEIAGNRDPWNDFESTELASFYWLLGMVLLYFVSAGVVCWVKSRSLAFLGWMVLAVAVTTILGLGLGILMLQTFSPETFESQGGGILFLVFFIPLFLGSGLLIGVWSVAWGYWFGASQQSFSNFLLWQGVGLLGSSLVGTVLPLIMVLLFSTIAQGLFPNSLDPVSPIVLGALVGSWLSSALVHGLIAGVVRIFSSS